MPKISVWALRLACVHLGIGLTAGALLLAHKGISYLPAPGRWFSIHFYTMLFGWTIQLVIGVAYWILPTFGGRSNTGNDVLAVAAIVLVNAGTLVGCFAAIFGTTATVAFSMQALAAVSFVLHVWPRVKAFGTG